ncbi:MAG: plasmid pRiA4b ORF-3 family protein, partial [Motiliproteus sp.]|nr:plasmid pRiA4b ORF-3 family protein [Motiliproteus sp.]
MAAVALRNKYLLRIELEGIDPVIWRTFELDSSASLAVLHEVVQIVMGWDNCHLHQFATGEAVYGVPDHDPEFDDGSIVDGSTVKLSQVLKASGDTLLYTYDFGDDWSHKLILVEVLPYKKGKAPTCVDGGRACPPENIGGIWGYEVLT